MNLTIVFTALYQKRQMFVYIKCPQNKNVVNIKRTVRKSPKRTDYIIH